MIVIYLTIMPILNFQIGVSLMANATVLSSGAGLGFPAITLAALTKDGDPMALNKEQGSWFGELIY